jgi:hypothetical protein
MKRIIAMFSVMALLAATVVVMAMPAFAQGGGIQEQRTNPAGNETQGKGNAITVTNVNPAGKAPAGQNR